MTELPLSPPLPPYFERLSSIGRAVGEGMGVRDGSGSEGEGEELFGLAKMRGGRGRRGAIALG